MSLLTETCRTDLVARPRRLAFWNDVAASTFGRIARTSARSRWPDGSASRRGSVHMVLERTGRTAGSFILERRLALASDQGRARRGP